MHMFSTYTKFLLLIFLDIILHTSVVTKTAKVSEEIVFILERISQCATAVSVLFSQLDKRLIFYT